MLLFFKKEGLSLFFCIVIDDVFHHPLHVISRFRKRYLFDPVHGVRCVRINGEPVLHAVGAGVVGGDGAGLAGGKLGEELGKVGGAEAHVEVWVGEGGGGEMEGAAELGGGGGEELHEAVGAGGADDGGIEAAFLADDGQR